MNNQPAQQSAVHGRLGIATVGALGAAIVLLITAVLPAEYGIDPLGIGRVLGLTAMADANAVVELTSMSETANTTESPLTDSARAYNRDTITFTLGPERWIEYKFALGQGATFLYQWDATGPLTFDFHTDPVGTAASESESFAQNSSASENGSYRAPYSGYHGWYWMNEGNTDVEVTLTAVGFFTQSREFHEDGSTVDHDLRPGATVVQE